eukprot:TRINITY_DN19040_c0_g1_i1.p1 TRINITY_DN19040_c0_g1~~TRINITY_DN19040_c0_g1_i1.p1  ORF type:complete len:1094 (-),score=417.05 TRINITY_DN19040_c0_g1_i1:277-3558(-)
MAALSEMAELEAELIKRNREIAKVRDETSKMERRLEDAQMRNDELLEKMAELDSIASTKTNRIAELEAKIDDLTSDCRMKEFARMDLEKELSKKLDDASKQTAEQEAAFREERASFTGLSGKVVQLELQLDAAKRQLQEAETRCASAKASMEQSEAAVRDSASKSLSQRRTIQELEEKVADFEAKAKEQSAVNSEEVERQAKRNQARIEELKSELDEWKRQAMFSVRELTEVKETNDDLKLEVQRLKASQEDSLQGERKVFEERLEKATSNAAALDGRLASQRMLLEVQREAMQRCEEEEERLVGRLEAAMSELRAEQEHSAGALASARDAALKDADGLRARLASELQSEEVCARRQARSEVDEHARAAAEAEGRYRTLEAQFDALRSEHVSAEDHHSSMHSTLKNLSQEARQKQTAAEEKSLRLEQEADQLRKDLEELRNDSERAKMAYKLEVERLQQTLEAESQSRLSGEQISASRIEEQCTLLEHTKAKAERLELDLEEHRRKITEYENKASKAEVDGEQKTHALNVRIASLEGELRKRQEKLTEVEGRLDAQRQYLEQLNETLSQERSDRETLMQTKGSLEAQLQLEATHKEAVSESLQISQEESSRRIRELEDMLERERGSHRDAMDDVRQTLTAQLHSGSERQSALENELLDLRGRCEMLMKSKTGLQQDVEERREKHVALEADLRGARAEQDRLQLDLTQHRQSKSSLETELTKLKRERLELESQVSNLRQRLTTAEEDASNERRQRSSVETSLVKARAEFGQKAADMDIDKRQLEQDLQAQLETLRVTSESTQRELGQCLARLEVQRLQIEANDTQRAKTEAGLRGDAATADMRCRRLEGELQRAQVSAEEARAELAHQQSASAAKLAAMEKQLSQASQEAALGHSRTIVAEVDARRVADSHQQVQERLAMSAEELSQRQVDFMLERQRLQGSLEESRRTLRASFGVPNAAAAVEVARLHGLEQQLVEERRIATEQKLARQQADRRIAMLEAAERSAEDRATARVREVERRYATLTEELKQSKMDHTFGGEQANEARERNLMAAAEVYAIRYESKYENVKLRGALEELRYVIKMQRPGAAPGPRS